MNLLEKIRSEGLRKDLPDLRPGDTLKVYSKIKEGDKERIQLFEGTLIRMKGHGLEKTFTVRKISYGVGVERIFPLHSPVISKIEIVSRGRARRAKLNFMRGLSGKKARLEGEEYEGKPPQET